MRSDSDVWGNLSFGDIAKLVSPVVNNSPTKSYADYNSDRITFYPTSGWTGSASFTAFVSDRFRNHMYNGVN